jgi:hypothetical protein
MKSVFALIVSSFFALAPMQAFASTGSDQTSVQPPKAQRLIRSLPAKITVMRAGTASSTFLNATISISVWISCNMRHRRHATLGALQGKLHYDCRIQSRRPFPRSHINYRRREATSLAPARLTPGKTGEVT